jgi:hypothetical protein
MGLAGVPATSSPPCRSLSDSMIFNLHHLDSLRNFFEKKMISNICIIHNIMDYTIISVQEILVIQEAVLIAY